MTSGSSSSSSSGSSSILGACRSGRGESHVGSRSGRATGGRGENGAHSAADVRRRHLLTMGRVLASVPGRGGTGGGNGCFLLRRWCSDVVGDAKLPEAAVAPSDCLEAIRRLVSASQAAGKALPELLSDARVANLLGAIGSRAHELSVEQVHTVLVTFGRAAYMPTAVWEGVQKEVPRAVEELPDNQTVHLALLMAALDLRGNMLLLHEVAEQLEARAPSLNPTLVAGSLIALSQLGPWTDPVPGGALAEQLRACFNSLGVRELSAAALAVATLGVGEQIFWHEAHGALLGRLDEMSPRNLTDVLMALASSHLAPITLMESLLARLALKAKHMDWEESIVCLWALCAVQLFPATTMRDLLEQACTTDGTLLSPLQANQLKQVMLTLDLERSAAKARGEVAPILWQKVRDLCEDATGETLQGCSGDTAEAEELCELVPEDVGVVYALAEEVTDFYIVDVTIRLEHRSPVAILFDTASGSAAEAPLDPWVTLKRRHLLRLGWQEVHWMPTRRWRTWDDEQRRDYVAYLVSK